eukprot:gene9928-10978_t
MSQAIHAPTLSGYTLRHVVSHELKSWRRWTLRLAPITAVVTYLPLPFERMGGDINKVHILLTIVLALAFLEGMEKLGDSIVEAQRWKPPTEMIKPK